MNCKFCGKEFDDAAAFCPECGKSVNEEVVAEVAEAVAEPVAEENAAAPAKKASKFKLDLNTVSLIVGTLIIFIGFLRLMNSSVSISSTSFGADFYTYAYKGIVACAEMLGKINTTLSWCLIALGVTIDLKALKERKNK